MYGDSLALSSTNSSVIFSSNSKKKQQQQEEELMSFDMNHHGLLRFRSAPCSLFSNPPDDADSNEGFLNNRSSSNLISQSFGDLGDNKALANEYSLNSKLPPYYPRQISSSANQLAAMDGSYRVASSMAMDHQVEPKMGSNLTRQSSSLSGLFSHLTAQNGYATIRGVGNYRVGNGANGDLSPSSIMLKDQMNFSSGVPSSLGMLSRISEMETENLVPSDRGDAQFYNSEYPFNLWNNSLHFAENFSGCKRELDDHDDGKLFASAQNGELGTRMPILSQHLSIPKTSVEMAAMETLLQFQDSVPCKIRAKRGCATHPRSIAERVRRTRISERMRKLQELVPNMDKQTNTADMLDLAVDYIKDLQKQFKILSDYRANCKCSSTRKPVPN